MKCGNYAYVEIKKADLSYQLSYELAKCPYTERTLSEPQFL